MTDQLQRVARQHLQTLEALGVDFVPLGRSAGEPEMSAEIEVTPAAARVVESRASEIAQGVDKGRMLEELKGRHDEQCAVCRAMPGIRNFVFGEGDPNARIMFVGEAPGEEEDRTGRPFVGRAGQKLDDIIKAMGLSRQSVYIANVLKSRPPENRTPLEDEVARCAPFLTEQIRIIQPVVLVSLGNPATKWLLQTTLGIMRLRGQWGAYVDLALPGPIPVMPTFHPSFLLRQYTRENREKVWSDMQQVMQKVRDMTAQ